VTARPVRHAIDWHRVLARLPYLVCLAIVFGIGLSQVVLAVTDWRLDDWAIYRAAADRILAGKPLYSAGDALHAYRYAPWLAYVAVPFSGPTWSAVMLAGSGLAVLPLMRRWRQPEALVLLGIFVPILFYLSSSGNVQGPMLAALVWGLPTRLAFLAVGLAASLKVTPILFAFVLVAERRWWQAAGAVLVAGVLWLPVLWVGTDAATFASGAAQLLPTPVWALAVLASVGLTGWLAYRRSQLTGLASGVAAILSLPRLFLYDVTMLLPTVSRRAR
jgi:hypothetical protein